MKWNEERKLFHFFVIQMFMLNFLSLSLPLGMKPQSYNNVTKSYFSQMKTAELLPASAYHDLSYFKTFCVGVCSCYSVADWTSQTNFKPEYSYIHACTQRIMCTGIYCMRLRLLILARLTLRQVYGSKQP